MARTPRPLITSEAFAALEPEWAGLHSQTPETHPFAHPAWHAAWLRHFGTAEPGGFAPEPVYLAVRVGEELTGVVPLDSYAGLARILGDANICDYAGIACAPGKEQALARGTLEWLIEDMTPGLDAWGLVRGSALHAAFLEAAEFWGWRCEEVPESVAPGVDLPTEFEAFVASLGKHDRHELRRKLRNLEAEGDVELRTTTESGEATEAAVTQLLAMMRASRRDKDEFLTPVMEAFFHDLAATFCGLGMARLQSLTVAGEPVASIFAFDCGGVRYLYNSGYDPEWATKAAGLLSKALSIRDAVEQGLSRFDFLRGEEHYKMQLGGVPREIVTLRLRQ